MYLKIMTDIAPRVKGLLMDTLKFCGIENPLEQASIITTLKREYPFTLIQYKSKIPEALDSSTIRIDEDTLTLLLAKISTKEVEETDEEMPIEGGPGPEIILAAVTHNPHLLMISSVPPSSMQFRQTKQSPPFFANCFSLPRPFCNVNSRGGFTGRSPWSSTR